MSTTDESQDQECIELLVETTTVRVWRVGTDYDIECQPGWKPEHFDYALACCGLTGRTDYDLSYIPETGMEIFRLPMFSVPKQKGLGWVGSVPAFGMGAVSTGLISGGGLFGLLVRTFGL